MFDDAWYSIVISWRVSKQSSLLRVPQITEGLRRVATLVDLGGREPTAFNRAVCKFTVRQAGQYRIAVLVGNVHVQGSPFNKTFLPGACECMYSSAPTIWHQKKVETPTR